MVFFNYVHYGGTVKFEHATVIGLRKDDRMEVKIFGKVLKGRQGEEVERDY